MSVEIVLNGRPSEVESGATLFDLLATLGLGARVVVVEINGEPAIREDLAGTTLSAGDVIEIVRPVAGG